MTRRKSIPQAELDKARALLEDGASQREVTRTTGISRESLRKYFPGQFWTFQEGGTIGGLTKHYEPRIRRFAA